MVKKKNAFMRSTWRNYGSRHGSLVTVSENVTNDGGISLLAVNLYMLSGEDIPMDGREIHSPRHFKNISHLLTKANCPPIHGINKSDLRPRMMAPKHVVKVIFEVLKAGMCQICMGLEEELVNHESMMAKSL